ncbi:MAG: hypothetical protein MJE68_16475, partial [Proteobacteria bacterium]|nr:hypothetical protein [Pseudomonadota bacterium]
MNTNTTSLNTLNTNTLNVNTLNAEFCLSSLSRLASVNTGLGRVKRRIGKMLVSVTLALVVGGMVSLAPLALTPAASQAHAQALIQVSTHNSTDNNTPETRVSEGSTGYAFFYRPTDNTTDALLVNMTVSQTNGFVGASLLTSNPAVCVEGNTNAATVSFPNLSNTTPTPSTVTFPAGCSTVRVGFDFADTNDDTLSIRNFFFSLVNGENYRTSFTNRQFAAIAVWDNDPVMSIASAQRTQTVHEGNAITITVEASAATASGDNHNVTVRVIADPANQVGGVGANYTVDFPHGATSATHMITTTNNTTDTTNNTVILEIVDFPTDGVLLGNGGYSKHATQANRRITATLVDGTPPPPKIGIFWRTGVGRLSDIDGDTSLINSGTWVEGNAVGARSADIIIRCTECTNAQRNRLGGVSGTEGVDLNVTWRIRQPDGKVLESFLTHVQSALTGTPTSPGQRLETGSFNPANRGTYESLAGETRWRTAPANAFQAGTSGDGVVGISRLHGGFVVRASFQNTADQPTPRDIIVELVAGSGYAIDTAHANATLTVYDDDPQVSLAAGNQYLLMGEDIQLTASGTTSEDHSLEFTVTDTAGVTGTNNRKETLMWGGSAASATLTVGTGMGTLTAANTTVSLALGNNATDGHGGGSPANVDYYVYSPPTISLGDISVTEGQGGSIPITLSHRYPRDITVTLMTADGTATAGDDYTALASTTATLAANVTSSSVAVQTTTDSLSETVETFTMEATATIPLASGTTTSADSGTVTIADDTADPVIVISASPTTVRPGENMTFTVTNVGNLSTSDLTVNVTFTGAIDMIGNAPYVGATIVGFTIPGNQTTGSFMATAFPRGSGTEDIVATLTPTTSVYTVAPAPRNTATVQIFSVEAPFVDGANATITSASVAEGGSVTLNVTLNPAQTSAVSLSYATKDGPKSTDADAGVHYTAATGTLAFAAGETDKQITVATQQNNVYAGGADPTFNVTLTGTVDGETLTSEVEVTIDDDDEAPALSLAGPSSIAPGENGTFTIRSARTVATASTTVNVRVSGNASAIYHVDSSGMVSRSVDVVANNTGVNISLPTGMQSVTFTIEADPGNEDELDPIVVSMRASNFASGFGAYSLVSGQDVATAQILEVGTGFADGAGNAINTVDVAEGASVTLNVTLTPAQLQPVEIAWTTGNASMRGGDVGVDYRAASGTVRFAPGEVTKQIVVQTLQNNVHERTLNRRFVVATSGVADGVNVSGEIEVTILDDDEVPELSLAGPGRIAPGENGTFTLRSARTVSTGIISAVVRVEGNVSRMYFNDSGGNPQQQVFSTNGSTVNIALPIEARSARFVVEADAGNETELDPIVLTLLENTASRSYTVSQTAGNTTTSEVRRAGLNPLALNDAILPQAVITVLDEVGSAIASRTHRSFGDTESADTRRGAGFTVQGDDLLTLAGREATREANENPWDAPGAASRQSLIEELDVYDLAFSLPLQAGEGTGNVAVWGQGFVRNIDGEVASADGSAIGFDGEVPGAMLGVDARVSDNLLAGIGFASSTADFEYQVADGTDEVLRGSHETEISTYHPYVGYRTEGGANVWANLGIGEGEVTITQPDDADYIGEIEVFSYAAGFNSLSEAQRDAVGGESLAWNWHGDLSFASVEETPTARTLAAGVAESGAGSELSVGRARLGAEISHSRELDGGGLFRRSIDLAVR